MASFGSGVVTAANLADDTITDAKMQAQTTTKITVPASLTTGFTNINAGASTNVEGASNAAESAGFNGTLTWTKVTGVGTAGQLKRITNLAVFNGATVAGNIRLCVHADVGGVVGGLVGETISTAQAGTSAFQDIAVAGHGIAGTGTVFWVGVQCSNVLATLKYEDGPAKASLTFVYGDAPQTGSGAAAGTTVAPYVRLSFVPFDST